MKIDSVARAIDNFPTLPTVYSALLELLSDIDTKISDIVNLISKDPAAVLKILKTANASYYGFSAKVENITSAITLLGFYEIKNIVMSLTLIDLFKMTKLNQLINPIDYWKHSIGVATISRRLGFALGASQTENYYLSGLLHDIGKLVLYLRFTSEYAKTLQYAQNYSCSLLEAEQHVLGINHQQIGEILAERWNLPNDVRNAIRYHHAGLLDDGFETQTAAVHLANIGAKILNMGVSGNEIIEKPNPLVWRKLGLPKNTFVNNFIPIMNDYQQSLQLFLL